MKTDEYDTYYAIGDVHGCAGLLYELLEAIDDDIRKTEPSRPVVVFLGDLIDRGPASYEVVNFLMHGWRYDFPFLVCRGNHETMTYASKFFGNQVVHFDESKWLDPNHHFYDNNSLMSYLAHGHELASHLNWFASLPCYVETPTFLFVHAGLPPETLYENEDAEDTEQQHAFKYSMTMDVDDCAKDDLMWIRGEFLRHKESHYRYVVHGHTPHKTAPHILHNRLNLDSGAVWSGRLSCAKLMEARPYQVEIFYTETNRYRETNVYKKSFFIPVNKDQVHQFPVMNLNQNLGY